MSDQFRYTAGLVRELLPNALNASWTGELPMPLTSYNDGEKIRSGKPISEGGDWLVMVLDVRRALKAGAYDVDTIARFLNGEPNQ